MGLAPTTVWNKRGMSSEETCSYRYILYAQKCIFNRHDSLYWLYDKNKTCLQQDSPVQFLMTESLLVTVIKDNNFSSRVSWQLLNGAKCDAKYYGAFCAGWRQQQHGRPGWSGWGGLSGGRQEQWGPSAYVQWGVWHPGGLGSQHGGRVSSHPSHCTPVSLCGYGGYHSLIACIFCHHFFFLDIFIQN